ncbi:hypothetical protein BJX65DRAFT_301484 [Aspergillus insuetus]
MSSAQLSTENAAGNNPSEVETLVETLTKAASSGDVASYNLCAPAVFKSSPIKRTALPTLYNALKAAINAHHDFIAHDLLDRTLQSVTGIDLENAVDLAADAAMLLPALKTACKMGRIDLIDPTAKHAQASLERDSSLLDRAARADAGCFKLDQVLRTRLGAGRDGVHFALLVLPCYAALMERVFAPCGLLDDRELMNMPPKLKFGTYSKEDCLRVLGVLDPSAIFVRELKEYLVYLDVTEPTSSQ